MREIHPSFEMTYALFRYTYELRLAHSRCREHRGAGQLVASRPEQDQCIHYRRERDNRSLSRLQECPQCIYNELCARVLSILPPVLVE